VFQVHGIDAAEKVVVRKQQARADISLQSSASCSPASRP
jgi:hypothetical protein